MSTFNIPYTISTDYTYDTNKLSVSWWLVTLKEDFTDLYARYHFNNDPNDSSWNWRNGVLIWSPVYSAGRLNNCIVLNWGTNHVSLGWYLNFDRYDIFSIGFWFKTTDNYWVFISKLLYPLWWTLEMNNGWIAFYMMSDWATSRLTVQTTTWWRNDWNWHHCVFTYDWSWLSTWWKFYMDWSLVTISNPSNNLSASVLNSAIGSIGSRNWTWWPNNWLAWSMDEVLIYTKVLNQTEVTYMYNLWDWRENVKYRTDKPAIYKTTWNTNFWLIWFSWFTELLWAGTTWDIQYQLSDNWTTWKYWNWSAWATVSWGTDYNSYSVINTNISTFDATAKTIYVKAFFISDWEQIVKLDSNDVDYTTQFTVTFNVKDWVTDAHISNIQFQYDINQSYIIKNSPFIYEYASNGIYYPIINNVDYPQKINSFTLSWSWTIVNITMNKLLTENDISRIIDLVWDEALSWHLIDWTTWFKLNDTWGLTQEEHDAVIDSEAWARKAWSQRLI